MTCCWSHSLLLTRSTRAWRVVVVVDSHVQRIVLATEETTVTQQVSHRPIKYQSRLWSQRGTEVNESHHGDNPLFRTTGIQIATNSYATLQVTAPTNIKTVHQTSGCGGIEMVLMTKAMAPTNIKTVHQTSGCGGIEMVLMTKAMAPTNIKTVHQISGCGGIEMILMMK